MLSTSFHLLNFLPMSRGFNDLTCASDSALQHLLDVTGQYPLMVVVLYRPDYASSWGNPGNHTPLVLKRLETAQTERILGAVLETDRLPEGVGTLWQRALR